MQDISKRDGPTTDAPFTYRQTGDGIFLVDDNHGATHLGTVQKFSGTEWWAYPANSAGLTQFTRGSRPDAAQALREHHTANTSVATGAFCVDGTCPGCPGCTPPGTAATEPVDAAESIGYRPSCRNPARHNGDARGCQMDDCPKHGGV